MAEWKISRHEAALDQLDWAIRLLIDYKAYPSSITLAGAAEEIIGKKLEGENAHDSLKPTVMNRLGLEREDEGNLLNKARNVCKHWDTGEKGDEWTTDFESETIQYIFRGMINLRRLNNNLPSEGLRFLNWIKTDRPDLHSEGVEHLLNITRAKK